MYSVWYPHPETPELQSDEGTTRITFFFFTLASQRLWSWTTPNNNSSSSRGRCSDMILMGRWNTSGGHAILSDFWLGINMAMEISQGPLFEACSSVVFESGGIRWKSRRCWTLTRLHTHRESDSFDCSHRNQRSITITLGGMKVKMCLFNELMYLCRCIIYTQYEQKQTADELRPKGANLLTVVSFSIYF